MKLLKKAKIKEYIEKYSGSLMVEVFLGSKPSRYLKVLTKDKNSALTFVSLGRVPKNIFTWHELTEMDAQPSYINVTRYKFVNANSVALKTDSELESKDKIEI